MIANTRQRDDKYDLRFIAFLFIVARSLVSGVWLVLCFTIADGFQIFPRLYLRVRRIILSASCVLLFFQSHRLIFWRIRQDIGAK
jgi:hypothetical protein